MAPVKRSAKDDEESGPRKKPATPSNKKDPLGYIPSPGASIPKARVRKNGVGTPTTIPQNVAAGASRQPSVVSPAVSLQDNAVDLGQPSVTLSAAKKARSSAERPAKQPYKRKSRAKPKPDQASAETPTKPSNSASTPKSIPPSARKGVTRSSAKPLPKARPDVPVVEASNTRIETISATTDRKPQTQDLASSPSTIQVQNLDSYGGSSNTITQAQAQDLRATSSKDIVETAIQDLDSVSPAPKVQSPIENSISSATELQIEKARRAKMFAEQADIDAEPQYDDPELNDLMADIADHVLYQPNVIQDQEGTVESRKKQRLGDLLTQATDGGTRDIFAVSGLGAQNLNAPPNSGHNQGQNVNRWPQITRTMSKDLIAGQQISVPLSIQSASPPHGASRVLYRGMGLPPDPLTERQIQNQRKAQFAAGSVSSSTTSVQQKKDLQGPAQVPNSSDQNSQQGGAVNSGIDQRRHQGVSDGIRLKGPFPNLSSSLARPISQPARVSDIRAAEGGGVLQTPGHSGHSGMSLHQQFLARTSGDHLFGLNFPLGKVGKNHDPFFGLSQSKRVPQFKRTPDTHMICCRCSAISELPSATPGMGSCDNCGHQEAGVTKCACEYCPEP